MRVFAMAILLACAPCLFAEVVDSGPGGFTVKVITQFAAPPAAVYAKLMQVGEWWNPRHTFSGDAHNLSLEAKPGGCFCEKLPGGGGVRHMEVINVAPGARLVMNGAIGPLQTLAAIGTMSFQVAADGAGTKLTVTYAVAGYLASGMQAWAAAVDSVISDQVARLKASMAAK